MTTPLLMRHASHRTSRAGLPGGYDHRAAVWMVDGEHGRLPIASAGARSDMELLTKTRVRQEVDDEDFSMLEIVTKTSVNQEADDDMMHAAVMLHEIVTKTDVQQEADDQVGQPGLDVI